MRASKLVVLMIPLAATLVLAPGAAHAKRHDGPCRADVERLCPGITPGGGNYHACLKEHAAELSPACQQQIAEMKAKMAAWQEACQNDVQTLCNDVQPGHGNIIKCLKQHHDQLSQSCQEQLAKRGRHHHHAPTSPQ